jgi:predicted nucleotidyltransferase
MLEAVDALVLAWAKAQPHIHALALCGSYARREQRPDSDIDFLVLSATPARFKTDEWLAELNFEQHDLAVVSTRDAQYGVSGRAM